MISNASLISADVPDGLTCIAAALLFWEQKGAIWDWRKLQRGSKLPRNDRAPNTWRRHQERHFWHEIQGQRLAIGDEQSAPWAWSWYQSTTKGGMLTRGIGLHSLTANTRPLRESHIRDFCRRHDIVYTRTSTGRILKSYSPCTHALICVPWTFGNLGSNMSINAGYRVVRSLVS